MANVLKLMSNLLLRKTTFSKRSNLGSKYSSVTRDLIRTLPKEQNATNQVHNHDILLGTLKTAPTTSNVLEIVKSHAVVMNNRHLMQALRSLFALQKRGQSKLSTNQILKHPDFELLCKTLRKHAGTIELNETIEALKVVCYVGVQSDSMIVQVLLQLLRHQVNHLSLQQIMFLDFLLSQLKATPLIEAMRMALPLIFEIQLSTKADRDNIGHLADCLLFASKKNVSGQCVEFLVNTITKYNGPIETRTAMSILWSLCEFKSNELFKPLTTRLIEDLIVDIDALNYGDIETTLTKLSVRYSSKHPYYYSDVFCDLVANYVIDHDLGCEAAIFILKKLHRLHHTNDKLLNYLSEKFVDDADQFHYSDPMLGFNYINALALSDFRPIHWETIKRMLANTDLFKNAEKRDIIWLRLAANLCILNVYKSDVFEMAFRESYIQKITKTNHLTDFQSLVLLNQCIMTYKPELHTILPNSKVIQMAASKIKQNNEYPLAGALLNVFGGDKYVKTGVTTQLHHQIDHVVVLRKGGYPVAFASPESPICLEEIEATEDSQILAIMGLNQHNFTQNSKRLKSHVAQTLRTLERRGCVVIAINTYDWLQLSDFERIPYLMRLIKSKTNENDLVCNQSM